MTNQQTFRDEYVTLPAGKTPDFVIKRAGDV